MHRPLAGYFWYFISEEEKGQSSHDSQNYSRSVPALPSNWSADYKSSACIIYKKALRDSRVLHIGFQSLEPPLPMKPPYLCVGRFSVHLKLANAEGAEGMQMLESMFTGWEVILTASEDITNQNSYLCLTRLILLLCISLWRHSTLTEIRLWSSFDSKRSQRNKTQIVRNYLSRLLDSVIVNFETLPHVFLPSYSRPPLP